jgi:hypothetical protein
MFVKNKETNCIYLHATVKWVADGMCMVGISQGRFTFEAGYVNLKTTFTKMQVTET